MGESVFFPLYDSLTHILAFWFLPLVPSISSSFSGPSVIEHTLSPSPLSGLHDNQRWLLSAGVTQAL